jgi:putative transposase
MRFRLIDQAKAQFPVQRLCKVLGVSVSGYFAWKNRGASTRQKEDMVLLAHIRSAFAQPNGTYGQSAHDTRVAGRGLCHRPQAHGKADAREQPQGPAEAAVQADD